jgi:glucose/arabinose dehydrogenase
MKSLAILLSALAISLGSFSCKEKAQPQVPAPPTIAEIDSKVLTSNLSQPWELVWGPDNFIWMTERGGRVSRVDPASGVVTVVSTLSEVSSRGEGGLLGMALHPNFGSVPEVFLGYNYLKNGSYTEKVVKYKYDGRSLVDPVVLLDNIAANSFHNGCRLLISKDKKLFITTGDAGNQPLSQSMNSVNGKVLRLNLDGSIPVDNPFPQSAVWSLGHRNAQGLVLAGDRLYSSEHGPDSDDEFNLIQKGRNYGWPAVKGFCDENDEKTFCTQNNIVEPLKAWSPTLAVCGIDYYDKDLIPQWKNSILMTTLKDNTLYQLKLSTSGDKVDETNEIIRGTYGRLRDVCVAPDGKVYIATGNGSNDQIIVISKK